MQMVTYFLLVVIIVSAIFLVKGVYKWITSGKEKSKAKAARRTVVKAAAGIVAAIAIYFIVSVILQLFGLGNIITFTLPTYQ